MDQPPSSSPAPSTNPLSAHPVQPAPAPYPSAAPVPAAPYAPMPPMAIPPDAAIATIGLTRVFGKKVAVNGLNLAVRRGEFFGFLGPNGAGKSTTIKMMVGLLRPSFGTAFIDGVDVWRDPLAAKKLIGILPEQLNLYERLTGREII